MKVTFVLIFQNYTYLKKCDRTTKSGSLPHAKTPKKMLTKEA
ncbi:hypothetical protein [Brunnivagina elsteri]|nr:hypothetical protein [Calothrix elsteri]